ncbi:MAG: transglycosylase domain-containing protein [Anaerolineae bacterium]|nr:transglycosylase domain-containing protein [Anaerolineae bacterium]
MPSVAHIIRRRRNRKQRRRRAVRQSRGWWSLIITVLLLTFIIPLLVLVGLASYLYVQSITYMPSPADTIYLDPIIGTTDFVDRSGAVLLYSVQDPLGDDRQWIMLESLPDYLIRATLQMEDSDFLEVGGFNLTATGQQLWRFSLNLANRSDSSIAGLLAQKTLVPTARNSGLDENLLAIAFTAEVQRQFTPRRVLEWYLNTNYYGNDAYGIEAAAQVYFGKSAVNLSLDEAAMLASIPPAPQFNPFDDMTAARGRQRDLLRLMLQRGYINQGQFDEAAAITTAIRNDLAQRPTIAPDFALYARQQSEDILNSMGLDGERLISRGGLRVTTTLDAELYYQAECTLRAHLQQLSGSGTGSITTQNGAPCIGTAYLRDVISSTPTSLPDEGSILIQDVVTGEIRVMVGNAVSDSNQPGPVLSPFIYLTGFLSGNFTPAKMVLDIPQNFPGPAEGLIYAPTNPDGIYRGPINLRDAMASGLRTAVVQVADREGLSNLMTITRRMGVTSLSDVNPFDLSVVERGAQVTLLDAVYGYSVFASSGVMRGIANEADSSRNNEPVAVLKIEDADGNILWDYGTANETLILSAEMAYLVNDILSDNTTRRNVLNIEDNSLNIDRPAAVTFGLTGDNVDNWTIGYTPQLVIGVHLGNSNDAPMTLDTYGLQGASPIWQAMMRYAHDYYTLPAASWSRPENLTEYTVCERSGLTPAEDNPCQRRTEIFASGLQYPLEDTYWRSVEVNSQTRTLASASTPTHLVIEEVYFVPPEAAREWWVANNLPLPPTEYDTLNRPEATRSTQVFLPQDFSYVGGEVDIRGNVDTTQLDFYQLRYGEGIRPTQWLEIGDEQSEFIQGTSLGLWDTSGLDGFYTLELAVRYTDGTTESAAVQVTVDNQLPTVTLLTGDSNETLYRFPLQTSIPITAEVSDNLAIDRVEFYHNGILLGIDNEWPYSFNFEIERTGIEIFSATVYDQVGNEARTEVEIEIIRSSGGE